MKSAINRDIWKFIIFSSNKMSENIQPNYQNSPAPSFHTAIAESPVDSCKPNQDKNAIFD